MTLPIHSDKNDSNTRGEGPIVVLKDSYNDNSNRLSTDDWNDNDSNSNNEQQLPMENITSDNNKRQTSMNSITLAQMEENISLTPMGGDDENNNNRDKLIDNTNSNTDSIHSTTPPPTSALLRFGLRFPRIVGVIFGIVIPLWVLVIVAAFFGYFLARIEAPSEIEQNNAIVANQMRTTNLTNLLLDLNVVTPRICWDIYKKRYLYNNDYQDGDTSWDDDVNNTVLKVAFENNYDVSSIASKDASVVSLNESSFLPFMYKCGVRATQITDEVMDQATLAISAGSSNLTFNWILCTPEMNGLGKKWDNRPNNTVRRPQNQTEYFTTVWQTNQQELYEQYLSSQISTNNTKELLRQKLFAYRQSLLNATGATACNYNSAASGWFWFTVMTSIGYGNYVPETTMGRLMIYTVGFLTILVFAIVLNLAGYVISAIFEDFLVRFRFRIFIKPWAAALLWGSAYYLWMFCIGNATKRWFRNRLGYDMSEADAYWFAYISTTTVGFGDIYLPASVFTGGDLLVFPILFLIGFVFLSAFLQHLATFLNDVFRGGRDKPYLDRIISQLAKVAILEENPTPVQIQNAIDAVLPPVSSDETEGAPNTNKG